MRREILNWLEQAEHDLGTAEYLYDGQRYGAATFSCQQAVEKALKALYIHKLSSSPGQTHSLIHLAKETKTPREFFELLQNLTPEFVTTRYPDVVGDVPYKLYGEKKTSDYVKGSRELIKWIKDRIPRP